MKHHKGNMFLLQCVTQTLNTCTSTPTIERLKTSGSVCMLNVCVCVSEFSLCSKQDVLSSMMLLWSGQPARRYPQRPLPLCQVPLSLSVAHTHPPTQTHTRTQPHASLNTMGICPTPPCHLAKNNSFGSLRHEDCIVTMVQQDFDQPKQHHAVILRYHTAQLTVRDEDLQDYT